MWKYSDLGNVGNEFWTAVESINVPANNWTTGSKKITLPPGKYIIIAHAEIPSGDNFGVLSVDEALIVERQQSFYSSPLIRKVTSVFFESITVEKTHKIMLWCNAAVTAQNCEVMAIRIK